MSLLQFLLSSRGLTYREIAKRIGCNEATIWRWATGVHKPQRSKLKGLASAFGVTAAALSEEVNLEFATTKWIGNHE